MELFTNQILAGISTGAIYACMALAVVMIYQAIDHLNFAQGEMAMFSTFISWQLMQWGVPYWVAFVLTIAFSFAAGIAIERTLFKPLAKAPILTNVAGFIALFSIINSCAGLIWDFTIKQYPTPFGSSPFLGSQLISTHQAGMIGVTLLMLVGALLLLPVHADGTCDAGRRLAAGIGAAGRHQHLLDDRAGLGHGGRDRRRSPAS